MPNSIFLMSKSLAIPYVRKICTSVFLASSLSLSAIEPSELADADLTNHGKEAKQHSVPELSTTILIGVGGILLIFRKRRIG